VDPGDVEGLAEALAQLAGDAALRKEMGRLGRERALDCFGWRAIAERTLALYDELLRERSA
jgi:starch synthase